MEARTGPDGLLALAAKTKSAALAALLVAAALLLGGCGGGDSGEPSSSSATTSAPQAKSAQGVGAQSAGKKQGSSHGQGEGGKQASQSPAQGPDSTKHGKRVTLPAEESEREPTATPAERAQVTVASISLSSPSLGAPAASGAFTLPARYVCADTWPTLQWTGVPEGTKELLLIALALEPANGSLSYNWGVAGIDPATQEIQAARLPPGAIVGTNSFGKSGYSICPPQGKAETYLFNLYALPESLHPARGFDVAAMRERALQASGNVGLLAVTAAR